jgi:hypothetical protein
VEVEVGGILGGGLFVKLRKMRVNVWGEFINKRNWLHYAFFSNENI